MTGKKFQNVQFLLPVKNTGILMYLFLRIRHSGAYFTVRMTRVKEIFEVTGFSCM
jgi:hypothetical protein